MTLPAPRILIVDDEEIVRVSLADWLDKEGYEVAVAADGEAALGMLREARWSVVMLDLKMPRMDGMQVLEAARKIDPDMAIVMITAYATVDTAVRALKLGAIDYVVKPFDPDELSALVRRIVAQQAIKHENAVLRRALKQDYRFHDMVSHSPVMQRVLALAHAAAQAASTVLVLGESGTGKELLARAIHAESPRRAGPFVAISCAALPDTLLESELFGHERGAFTGAAARRKGTFEAASGGTLFLDEIGDIGPKLQLDLLRVLEERRFFRVGGTESISVDVRIVAATNRDLKKAVENGSFREDLFYRLNVIPITLPPLRERREDVPALVDLLLERLSIELKRPVEGVSREAMAHLIKYGFPGNIRELRNLLERALVTSSGPVLHLADLELPRETAAHPDETLESVEREHIAQILAESGGNVSQAARVLDIDRVTLYNKIRKYGLRPVPADRHRVSS